MCRADAKPNHYLNPTPMASTPDTEPTSLGMHEESRRAKLRKIAELGHDPWGQRFDDHLPIAEIRAREGEIKTDPLPTDADPKQQPEQHGPKVRAAGRIMLHRKQGKLIFLTIQD